MEEFSDTDHDGDKYTCWLHSVILIYLNRDRIIWYSKNHNNDDLSTFGYEVVGFWTGLYITKGLWYKLRMIDIPINWPTSVFCDNKSVVTSTYVPEPTLARIIWVSDTIWLGNLWLRVLFGLRILRQIFILRMHWWSS